MDIQNNSAVHRASVQSTESERSISGGSSSSLGLDRSESGSPKSMLTRMGSAFKGIVRRRSSANEPIYIKAKKVTKKSLKKFEAAQAVKKKESIRKAKMREVHLQFLDARNKMLARQEGRDVAPPTAPRNSVSSSEEESIYEIILDRPANEAVMKEVQKLAETKRAEIKERKKELRANSQKSETHHEMDHTVLPSLGDQGLESLFKSMAVRNENSAFISLETRDVYHINR